ncbi:Mitochondrial import receptor subunit TOM7 [Manis javanica]|nr:Mitochondrial import receptor subunit TOM7 [Manis javanica]
MHAFSTGRRGGERRVKDDELRPPLATLTTPAVKALWCACASSLFFRIPDVVAAVPRLCTVPVVVMVKLSKEAKQRLQQLFKGGQFAIRWGFIPLVIYLGFKRGADPGMPEPTVLSLLWG